MNSSIALDGIKLVKKVEEEEEMQLNLKKRKRKKIQYLHRNHNTPN